MHFLRLILSLFLGAAGLVLCAQSTVPALSGSIPAQAFVPGAAANVVDLREVFTIPGVTGQIVQFQTVVGAFNVHLRSDAAPLHVANFLNYVQSGAYTNAVFHRSVGLEQIGQISIVQGGGYRAPIVGSTIPAIPRNAPVPLEYNLPNARGTLAAARAGGDLNSATSEWYFNTRDNSTILGQSNGGGYTVFGEVMGTGMSVVDLLAAFPTVNVGSPFVSLPVRNWAGGNITDANLVLVNSLTAIPLHPSVSGSSGLIFSVESSNAGVVTAALAGSLMSINPGSAGTAIVTVRASDVNDNSVNFPFAVTVGNAPAFTTQPVAQGVAAGGEVTLSATATGATSYQWQRDGVNLPGATGPTLTLTNLQPANAGMYVAIATGPDGTTASQPAIVGVLTASKVTGTGTEVGFDIVHPNGNTFDQVLLQGAAATITADPGQITRMSYIDLNDDIVQVEFSGAGALTLTLENATGPAWPANYNQEISYMKGLGSIVVAGADESTHVGVFSVGRITAVNPDLFRDNVTYDGMANIVHIAIHSTNGKFGGLRAANTSFVGTRGVTGLHAPGVQFVGGPNNIAPVFLGDVTADSSATPVIITRYAPDMRITGGDLLQLNGRAVQVDGMTRIQMAVGTNSHGTLQSAQPLRARLERSGVDVTDLLVPPGGG